MKTNTLDVDNGLVRVHLDQVQATIIEAWLQTALDELSKQQPSWFQRFFGMSDKKRLAQMSFDAAHHALAQLKTPSDDKDLRVLRLEQTEAGLVALLLEHGRDTVIAKGTNGAKGTAVCFDVALAQLPTTYQMPEWIVQALFQMASAR